jgi:acyl carrier protein
MTLEKRLEDIFREIFNEDTLVLSDETTPQDVPGWDSVAHINLMFGIEQTFGVQFTGEELAAMGSFGEIKKFLLIKGCS